MTVLRARGHSVWLLSLTHFPRWWCNSNTCSQGQGLTFISPTDPKHRYSVSEPPWRASSEDNAFMIKGHGPDPRLELRCGYWAAGMRRIRVSCQTLFPFNITDVTALRPSVRQTGRSPELQDSQEVSGSTWMWQKDVCRNWIQSDWSIVDLRGFSPLSLLFLISALSVVLFTH